MPESRSPGEALESVAEARSRLGVSNQTFYRLIHNGEVDTLRIGRARRVVSSSVDAFIRRQVGGSKSNLVDRDIADAAAVLVTRSCEAQGLQVQILDPDTLAKVAGLISGCARHLEAAS